jgi:hypothetical protein
MTKTQQKALGKRLGVYLENFFRKESFSTFCGKHWTIDLLKNINPAQLAAQTISVDVEIRKAIVSGYVAFDLTLKSLMPNHVRAGLHVGYSENKKMDLPMKMMEFFGDGAQLIQVDVDMSNKTIFIVIKSHCGMFFHLRFIEKLTY